MEKLANKSQGAWRPPSHFISNKTLYEEVPVFAFHYILKVEGRDMIVKDKANSMIWVNGIGWVGSGAEKALSVASSVWGFIRVKIIYIGVSSVNLDSLI